MTTPATITLSRVRRSTLTPAPFNPRVIDKHARRQLRESINTFGLVEPIVYNRRSGYILGGHQRLSILDEQHGYPPHDYDVDVSVVDLAPIDERRLCVLLNQPNAQGSFDLEALGRLIDSTPGLDPASLGFDAVQLATMFSDLPSSPLFSTDTDPAAPAAQSITAARERADSGESVADYKAKKARVRAQLASEKDDGFYIVLVAPSRTHIDAFLKFLDLPLDDRYHDLTKVAAACGIALEQSVNTAKP